MTTDNGGGSGFDPNEYGNDGQTDADRKRQRNERLREGGLPLARTKDELLDEIDRLLSGGEGKSAEDIFREGLDSSTGDPLSVFKRAGEQAAFEVEQGRELPNLLSEFFDRYGSETGGRTFRPSVLQQPSEGQLFNSVENAATGPAPDLLFRDVFAENFGDFTQMSSPYDKFVAGKAKELESRFMTDIFKQFNEPGFQEGLRADYEKLYRTKERGDFDGAGGSVPAFEDFIKERVKGNFRGFLETEKPKLQQAFELTAPNERGQRDAGQIAPLRRIL